MGDSKNNGLKYHFVDMNFIAEELLKEEIGNMEESAMNGITEKEWNSRKRKKAESITRNFTKVLKGMKLNQEEIALFRSESSGNSSGKYIFNSLQAKTIVSNLIRLYKDCDELFSSNEKEQVKRDLIRILPMYRKIDDISESDESEFVFNDDIVRLYNLNKLKIEAAIDKFYLDKLIENTEEYFRERVFVEVNKNRIIKRTGRSDVYKYQIKLIESWKNKWLFIMNEADAIRKAEKFDNTYISDSKNKKQNLKKKVNVEIENLTQTVYCISIYDLYEGILSLYENREEDDNKNGNQDLVGTISENGCFAKCKEAVDEILGKKLEEFNPNDYYYLMGKAFDELESIYYQVKQKEVMVCYKEKGRNEQDIEKLYSIRERINEKYKRLNIFDFL